AAPASWTAGTEASWGIASRKTRTVNRATPTGRLITAARTNRPPSAPAGATCGDPAASPPINAARTTARTVHPSGRARPFPGFSSRLSTTLLNSRPQGRGAVGQAPPGRIFLRNSGNRSCPAAVAVGTAARRHHEPQRGDLVLGKKRPELVQPVARRMAEPYGDQH